MECQWGSDIGSVCEPEKDWFGVKDRILEMEGLPGSFS